MLTDDTLTLALSSTRTFDILANDLDFTGTGLTITHIDGVAVVPGDSVLLASGATVTLNLDGTLTVSSTADLGTTEITYSTIDGEGTEETAQITLETVADLPADGIVEGTAGGDLIDTGFVGDPGGDVVDGNDAQGVWGTVGDDDFITGWGGNDTVFAGAGNDVVFAGSGGDLVDGGTGDDAIFGEAGDDTAYGGIGDDQLSGDGGNDLLFGGSGNDALQGGEGNDSAEGGEGDDILAGNDGDDTLVGEAGNDTLFGGAGDDLLTDDDGITDAGGGEGNDTILLGAGDDTASGDQGDDTLSGGAGDDALQGNDGADSILGGDGFDTIFGGDGGDTIDGGADDDAITGEGGDDQIAGGSGADTIQGNEGDDTISGDEGNDFLIGGDGADAVYGGAGDDVLMGHGNPVNLLENGSFEDVTGMTASGEGYSGATAPGGWEASGGGAVNIQTSGFGGPSDGDNWLDAESGPAGTMVSQEVQGVVEGAPYRLQFDAIDGPTDDNAVNVYWNGVLLGTVDPDPYFFNTYVFDVVGGPAGSPNILSFESLGPVDGSGVQMDNIGLWGPSTLAVTAAADSLYGGIGNDTILAAPGAFADGGADRDTLIANDVLSVAFDPAAPRSGTITFIDASTMTFANIETLILDGVAMDTGPDGIVNGTAGDDSIGYGYIDGMGDRVDGFDATQPGAGLNDDVIDAGAGADTVQAGQGDDTVFGGTGADVLSGEEGDDSLDGGEDADTIYGGGGADTIEGGAGDDSLFGVDGADLIYGGEGADELVGSTDGDTLYGGAGADTLRGDEGDDSLYGGDDADAIFNGSGAGFVDGGEGGNDNDTLYVNDVASVVYDPLNGESGTVTFTDASTLTFVNIEHLIFNGGPDGLIYGTADDNLIDAAYVDYNGDRIDAGDAQFPGAGPNDDEVYAQGGNDTVYSGEGKDYVYGGEGNDALHTGEGNDYAQGDTGNDTVMGEGGNDFLRGDAGNDEVYGGDGDDSVYGGANDDHVYAGDGNDSAYGGFGNDFVYGGAGSDTITGSDGNDAVFGGEGDDTLNGSTGNDTLYGDEGNDQISGDEDRDVIYGGPGDLVYGGESGDDFDTLHVSNVLSVNYDPFLPENGTVTFNDGGTLTFFGIEKVVIDDALPPDGIVEGTIGDDLIDAAYRGDPEGDRVDAADNPAGTDDDVIEAGSGKDTVLSGAGADHVSAGEGDDQVFGGAGSDTLLGEGGNDALDGGEDADDLSGGAGDDTLEGGAGDDVLAGDAGSDMLFGDAGNDTLTGGGTGNTLYGGDDRDTFYAGAGDSVIGGEGGDDVDTLDLRGAGPLRVVYDPTDAERGTVEFLDADRNVIGTLDFAEIENVVPCFTPGTLILTDRGDCAVETLVPGDRVLTRDHGYQTVRWVGRRDLSASELRGEPRFYPVRIARGALGEACPERDMLVSPQHRMLISGARAEMFFGEHEVLVAAAHLVGQAGVSRVLPEGVSYIHILFDRHEIIHADGAWTESFQPGDMTLGAMGDEQRAEIFALFPELADSARSYIAARRTLRRHEAELLLA